MLRTLLTPFSARFDISPRLPTNTSTDQAEDQNPEDFARDVLIELMRNAVENLKQAGSLEARLELLAEIQRIMDQNPCTKEVFREMDGFVCLMSDLMALRDQSTSDDSSLKLKALKLVLVILSNAMFDHSENANFFENTVGYEPLSFAMEDLATTPHLRIAMMDMLLSFALHDFISSDFFLSLHNGDSDSVDQIFSRHEARFQFIYCSKVIPIIWSLLQRIWSHSSLRYGFAKVLDRLANGSHRNLVLLSTVSIIGPIFDRVFEVGKDPMSENERQVWRKLLRKLFDIGAESTLARSILRKTVRDNGSLDPEIVDIVRYGMRSRWPDHFSLESASTLVISEDAKGLPVTGFTFLAWIWLPQLREQTPLTLFNADMDTATVLNVRLRTDGKIELFSSANHETVIFSKGTIRKMRWTHFAFVHYPSRSSNPSIRLFIDGVIQDTVNWSYPKPPSKANSIKYKIGGREPAVPFSWCLSSSYLLSTPLLDDLIRFVYHLGPKYIGHFQDSRLVRFLTYDASTSLNMFLTALASKNPSQLDISPILKAVRHGIKLNESQIIFSLNAAVTSTGSPKELPSSNVAANATAEGDLLVVHAKCFDNAVWELGGAAVTLKLVQLAQSPHELSRALCILMDSLKNNWQNSEDMERLRGYEILADMLRKKSQHINLTSFETLFEFLGINSRHPEQSTVVNPAAYRAIALDFELWSQTRQEIQSVYFEHFTTLLETSRYKAFNITQRFSKFSLVRRLLFVLQTSWFSSNMTNQLIETLAVVCKADFSRDVAIKPVVSYLAANLHDDVPPTSSSRSIFSGLDDSNSRAKSEQVLQMMVSILSIKQYYNRFVTALPLTRICLLLLGERPGPPVATQILRLLDISIGFSTSFIRKFELVNGWNVLKTVLPPSWDVEVNDAAFNLLLGRAYNSPDGSKVQQEIRCPQILSSILVALKIGLSTLASTAHLAEGVDAQSIQLPIAETRAQSPLHPAAQLPTMEALMEELLNLHSSVTQFRQTFQSHMTTQLFIDGYKNFVDTLSSLSEINSGSLRILEKVTHFGLALALDNCVAGSQKREILDIISKAEAILNPNTKTTVIDPSLVADRRTLRQRLASARFSLQIGERTIMKIILRVGEWRKTIKTSERKRLRKSILDLRETRRQVSQLQDWLQPLVIERGLWPSMEVRRWRLNETEGPHRIRNKLEPEIDKVQGSRSDVKSYNTRGVHAPQLEQKQSQTEAPPWAESYEISSTEMDEPDLADEVVDDKLRRVRHELEPGDVIEAVATVARIAGVDSSPGLLIIGHTHLYMLDGVVQNDDGEIIDAHDAPKRLLFVPGSIVEIDGPQRAQRWTHNQLLAHSEKTFLFRDVALEIYFKNNRSLLIVFLESKTRTDMSHRLSTIINRNASHQPSTPGILRSPIFGKHSDNSQLLLGFKLDDLPTATRKWQAREISNFTYLSILNQISGRTPNDATQYPVFPWVLQNYTSEKLDLDSPATYRDLSRPMGALTETRIEDAKTRYESLKSVGEKPFHYGTHFSSSMIVCHFLIRLAPFTNMFKTLQGGDWDLPDRLFSEVKRAYESAAYDQRGDVRELIPEFFTSPEFLENSANHDFGVQQSTGDRIHDVKLPPWAKADPLLFITLHRRALESPYVSEHLPAWIDLIWGYKQKDPEALNVFHPLSYEGAINLDEIKDDLEREATVGIIHNFGQTPHKLFTSPHPARYNHGLHTLPLGTLHGIAEDATLLTQAPRCFRDLGYTNPVRTLAVDSFTGKVLPCSDGFTIVPGYSHEQIEWNTARKMMRLVVDQKIVQLIEDAPCTSVAFLDSECLITGFGDYTVRQWRLCHDAGSDSTISQASTPTNANTFLPVANSTAASGSTFGSSGQLTLIQTHIMRTHTAPVTCVAASKAWNAVVSGSKDGSAVIWEVNRGREGGWWSLWHAPTDLREQQSRGNSSGNGREIEGYTVHLVAINESTGYVASCSPRLLLLHTLNARPIASLDLSSSHPYHPIHRSPRDTSPNSSIQAAPAHITSLAFLEREYSWKDVLGVGGADGSISLLSWEWDWDGTKNGDGNGVMDDKGKQREDVKNNNRNDIFKWKFVPLRRMHVRPSTSPGVRFGVGLNRSPAVTALRFIGEKMYHGEETGKTFVWTLPDSD